MLAVILLTIQKIHRLRDKETETHKPYKYETWVQIMKEEKENNVQKTKRLKSEFTVPSTTHEWRK